MRLIVRPHKSHASDAIAEAHNPIGVLLRMQINAHRLPKRPDVHGFHSGVALTKGAIGSTGSREGAGNALGPNRRLAIGNWVISAR